MYHFRLGEGILSFTKARSALRHNSVVLCCFVVCAVLFSLLPALDVRTTALFYHTEEGFFWQSQPIAVLIYNLVPLAAAGLAIGLIAALLLALFARFSYLQAHRREVVYLLLVLLLGPGLVVNLVFKDHWGRARPNQVQQFGGSQQFTPALLPTQQCGHNCSFVSGHASLGFYLLAMGFVKKQHRRHWMAVGLMTGATIGLVRIVQGGHFLSDVVFAFFAVYAVAWLLHFWLLREEGL